MSRSLSSRLHERLSRVGAGVHVGFTAKYVVGMLMKEWPDMDEPTDQAVRTTLERWAAKGALTKTDTKPAYFSVVDLSLITPQRNHTKRH